MKPGTRERAASPRGVTSGVALRLRPVVELTPDQLLEPSSLNRDLRLEMTAEGGLIVMNPTGGWSDRRKMNLATRVGTWAERDGTGVAFDSSTGFVLPNGAIRSPDASWIENTRLEALGDEQLEKYLPLCPEFVVELLSPSDRLSAAHENMREYTENGARLGWLLVPASKRVYVYRSGGSVEEFEDPAKLSAEPVLPGFTLEVRAVW